ncbi:hypothetical protein IFR05_008089 [Cadophora sp. M221]|nr:hypothetical protein IFR05_008089 [Cadophora sp. M221]
MRLLNTATLKLEEFFGSDIPEYAILSHTWEDEEVSFQEVELPSATTKKGFLKTRGVCKEALKRRYTYVWVDTCCIDKKSSAELTESINSMFQWYQDAKECFVYLSDLKSGPNVSERLKNCRWFTRGWTLQELIAPRRVRFYDGNWDYVGSKHRYATEISSITNIGRELLLGTKEPAHYSIATRMSWAAHRQATRIEDRAYCLLGLFDVNMPMLYGEGMRAFGRLQEEIIKRSNDMTIFAWTQPEGQPEVVSGALFAPSPACFAQSGDIYGFDRQFSDLEFALTNKGLRIDKCVHFFEVISHPNGNKSHATGFAMFIGYSKTTGPSPKYSDILLNLWKVGPNSFLRESISGPMENCKHVSTPILSFYITANTHDFLWIKHAKMNSAVKFPVSETIEVRNTIPHSHWDHARQLFFAPTESRDLVLAASVKIALAAQIEAQIIICFDFTASEFGLRKLDAPRCLIFNERVHAAVSRWLFRHKRLGYNGHDATWSDVLEEMKEIFGFSERLRLSVGESNFIVQASVTSGAIESISAKPIYSVELVVEEG